MEKLLILYCAFAYGFEFSRLVNFMTEEIDISYFKYYPLVPIVAFIIFLFAPISFFVNCIINTIRTFRGQI